MITLKTGVPGASKTLSAVHELAFTLGRQVKGKEETRPIFVHGVKDLSLPHFDLPDATKWADCPEGAIVIIDEAQGTFPPRSSTSKAPAHVEALNTHRHKGIDLVVITQHPKLIDQAVRRLVGKHQHYRRLYGGKTSICYEWDHCEDSLVSIKTASKSFFRQPKDAFKYYKSSEVHTKQKFKVPPFLYLFPVAVVALAIYGAPTMSRVLTGKQSEAQIKATSLAAIAPSGAASSSPTTHLAAAVTPAVPAAAVILGCIKLKARCECMDGSGSSIPVDYDKCTASSARGGLLVPYGITGNGAVTPRPASTSPAASSVIGQWGGTAVSIGGDYQPRNPVRDLSGTLASAGPLLSSPSDDDGNTLAWMRSR